MAQYESMADIMIVAKGVGATPSTWRRWDDAAKRDGKKRQQWIRDVLTAAAEQSERRQRRSGATNAAGRG